MASRMPAALSFSGPMVAARWKCSKSFDQPARPVHIRVTWSRLAVSSTAALLNLLAHGGSHP
jgi:hypothetical protein